VLLIWSLAGTAVILALLPRATGDRPVASADTATWLADLNAFRIERRGKPLDSDPRLAQLLEAQARGEITLTELLDEHAALCASGRWLVLAAGHGENLPTLLPAYADSLTGPEYTEAAVDLLSAAGDRPAAYRILLCRPY
jgi:hypothetical protein